MTDVTALAADLFPGAKVIGSRGRRLGPIAWVRVMRGRVPAFDALDPGDLVIAPPSAIAVAAPGPAELADLAAALAAVPVSGVLLPSGEERPDALAGVEAIAQAIARAGVPVVCVAGAGAAALERTVVGYIVARGAELERQAALLEGELRRRSLEGGGAAALLAAVSGFLGRALALEGSRGEPLAVHVPADAPAATPDAAAYQANAGRGARGTTVARRSGARTARGVALRVPLPAAEGKAGAIAVLGEAPASELARITLPRVAGLLALELAREEAVRSAADRARRGDPMPSAGPPWVVAIARQRQPRGADDGAVARDEREQQRRAIRLLAPARRMSLRGDADSIEIRAILAVDAPGGPDPDGRLAGMAMADQLARTVALSRPFDHAGARPAAEAEARATLEAAERLPAPGSVVFAARLAAYGMLGALHQLGDGPRHARALLEPLLTGRPDVVGEHLATLAAFLERGGVGEAASALGIHRNTATYRLHRIEALTGWDLADPDLRLALAIALRLVQDR